MTVQKSDIDASASTRAGKRGKRRLNAPKMSKSATADFDPAVPACDLQEDAAVRLEVEPTSFLIASFLIATRNCLTSRAERRRKTRLRCAASATYDRYFGVRRLWQGHSTR